MAGLICIYDTKNFYYLHITWDEKIGKCLDIMTCIKGDFDYPLDKKICIKDWEKCFLKADVKYDKLFFSYSRDNNEWSKIEQKFDCSTLSDEFDDGGTSAHFTGAFVGLCCQDITGERKHADFDFFEYIEH
jgi:xylan 1,4-beta-xylosidase